MRLNFKSKLTITNDEISFLIFLGAFIFGLWLRVFPAMSNSFPINDGGMFYTMIRDLRQNGYFLPANTTYNDLNIPYSYPPLAFYLAGFITDIFRISDFKVLLWLPIIVNILTMPAFTLLAYSLLNSRLKSAVATLFYALTPLSIDWLIMGGGLTRGLGQLFLILTVYCTHRLFYFRSKKFLILTITFSSLVILTHPESALLTLISAIILWVFSSRSKQTMLDVIYVCAGVILICSPWLLIVIQNNGVTPFLNTLQTNGSSLFMWTSLFSFTFAQETGLTIISVLGLIGLFLKIGQNDYLLPVLLSLPFFINPRSAARFAIIPLAVLGTISLLDVIIPALNTINFRKTRLRNIANGIFLSYLLFYMLFNSFILDLKIANNRLSNSDQKAMFWVSQNTSIDSKFIILTGETQMMRDPVQEWFPALAERRSQTTLQGLEWILGGKFIDSIVNFPGLLSCIQQDISCIKSQTALLGIRFDHVYLKKVSGANCGASGLCPDSQALISDLRNSSEFKIVFENDATAIFEKINQ